MTQQCSALLLGLALLAWQGPACAQPLLPADILGFVREREVCDHWRGEEAYDAERGAEINAAICSACVGSDKKLSSLKAKYAQRSELQLVLSQFEPQIESARLRAPQFCQSAYQKLFDLQNKQGYNPGFAP